MITNPDFRGHFEDFFLFPELLESAFSIVPVGWGARDEAFYAGHLGAQEMKKERK
jgi:hypothetical protein